MTQTIAEIKREILAKRDVEKDLKPIIDAGASRDALLDLLVRAVVSTPDMSVADRIRKKQQELRSVAAQVRTVVSHAERVANEQSSYLEFLSPFHTADFERYRDEEIKRRAARWPFQEMHRFADWAENEARKFGELLRRNGPAEGRLGIFFLLSQVYLQTGKLFENQLARLLTDASAAIGETKTFSASNLTKTFKRHVLISQRRKREKR